MKKLPQKLSLKYSRKKIDECEQEFKVSAAEGFESAINDFTDADKDIEMNENTAAMSAIDEPIKNLNGIALKKNETEVSSQNEKCAPSCNEGTSNSKSDEQLNIARHSEKEAVFDANLSNNLSNSIVDRSDDASHANFNDDYSELNVVINYYNKILIENARKMQY